MSRVYVIEFYGNVRPLKDKAASDSSPTPEIISDVEQTKASLSNAMQHFDKFKIAHAINKLLADGHLPNFLESQIKIEFIHDDHAWAGVLELVDWYDRLGRVKGLEKYFERLLRSSVTQVMRKAFALLVDDIDAYDFRSVAIVNAPQHSLAEPKNDVYARKIERLLLFTKLNFLFLLLLVIVQIYSQWL